MSKENTEIVPVDGSEEKPRRKWPILVLAVLLSLSAVAGGLALSLGVEATLALVVGGGSEDPDHESKGHASEDVMQEGQHATNESLVVDPLKEIIVNITSITETGRKSSRFLKLNLALVFDANAENSEHVTERKVYIRDAFQNYLRQLTERDLSGAVGVIRLKSELLRRARAVTESEAPKEVLISDIIVQ